MAYKLALPPTSQIHLIFHVSQLKQAVPITHDVADLPTAIEDHQVPEQVLQRCVVSSDNAIVLQGLIKWSGLPRSLATWEYVDSLRQRFPRAPAWGQAASKGGGVSSLLLGIVFGCT